jgi:class 3 adenylate cyclase
MIGDYQVAALQNRGSRRGLERRLAAILAADIMGYSALMERNEDETHARVGDELEQFRYEIEKSHGRVFSFVGSDDVPFAALAEREGVSPSYFTRLVRLSYLAPDITRAILNGRQLRDLTAEKLLEHSRLPLAWHDQRAALGFA